MTDPTYEDISKAVSYDPETGLFTRIGPSPGAVRRVQKRKLGQPIGSPMLRGYVGIPLSGRTYYAHRLAFLLMTGSIPEFIDHRDGDGMNNRWENLRGCTKSQNMANRGPSIKSTSGIKGVYLTKSTGRWRAQIIANNRTIHLGYYADRDAAAAAYNSASREHFGEFAHSTAQEQI